ASDWSSDVCSSDLFEKSGPEFTMNSDRRRNNLLRNLSVSEILSCVPAFLIHLDRSRRSGFFPARIVGHWRGGNLLLFDQFFRRVFRWKRRWDRFCCAVCEFLWKFFDQTLCRPRASFAESADRTATNVVPIGLQCASVFGHSAAAHLRFSHFLHPSQTSPA